MDRKHVKEHLSLKELAGKMESEESLDGYRRWQVIYLRAKHPDLSVSKIADMCGVKYRTVTQWVWLYNKKGPKEYELKGRGGRRYSHLSLEEEKELLERIQGKAKKGTVITALQVKKEAEKVIGTSLPKDYAYDLLHRHGWRKVMPRTVHPKKEKTSQEDFKKNSRKYWLPPEEPFH